MKLPVARLTWVYGRNLQVVPTPFSQMLSINVFVKAHVNGHNIVDQQHSTLLGPTCCVRLHGTTTMLALVAYSLKPVKLLSPCKRTQHYWPKNPTTRNNVVTCCVRLHGPQLR